MWDWLPHLAVLLWTVDMAAWLLLRPTPAGPGRQPDPTDGDALLRRVRDLADHQPVPR